jgi:hypothetical protein
MIKLTPSERIAIRRDVRRRALRYAIGAVAKARCYPARRAEYLAIAAGYRQMARDAR